MYAALASAPTVLTLVAGDNAGQIGFWVDAKTSTLPWPRSLWFNMP